MKLNSSGRRYILRGLACDGNQDYDREYLKKLEFTYKHFKNCRVFTEEELEGIATFAGQAEFYLMQNDAAKAKELIGRVRDLLVERINQAEKIK